MFCLRLTVNAFTGKNDLCCVLYHCELVSLMQNTDDFHLTGSSRDGLLSFINYWNGFTNCKMSSLLLLTLTMKEICCQLTMMKI